MLDLFGPNGALAAVHPAYTPRPEQAAMAQAVAATLEHGGVLMCEAGTGTGKSLAYLAPVALAQRRVVISTATHALQGQLLREDVPLLSQMLGRELRAELLKGRANYVCRLRARDLETQLFDERFAGEFVELLDWLERTETGDRAELEREPSPTAWRELSVGPDRCRGSRCPEALRCFAEQARARASDADIVIVNHALLFADLSVRAASDGLVGVLPEYDCVILDEAHELEDAAADWLGARFAMRDLTMLARETERACRVENAPVPGLLLHEAQRATERVFAILPSGAGRVRLGDRELRRVESEALVAVRGALRELAAMFADSGEARDLVSRQAERMAAALDLCVLANLDETVVWRDGSGGESELRASPIDVAPLLRDKLWDKLHAAVLTSATLSIEGDLGFTRRRLGVDHATELVLASPFDVQANALLYLPEAAPDPRAADWDQALARQIVEIVIASEGRALCLFTSTRALKAARAIAGPQLSEFTLLAQGEAPRERLLERFRADVRSVLFATTSFWQGVDIRGEACSCVIIDRLPFPVPSDPLVAGRCERIEREGGSAFCDYSLPQAALMLRQGFGRLLRGDSDRGVVAILDARARRSSYSRQLLAALPQAPVTTQIADVRAFFRRDEVTVPASYAESL